MKGVLALAVLLIALIAALAVILEASPVMREVGAILGLGFGVAVTLILRGPLGQALAQLLGAEDPRARELQSRLSGQLDEVLEELRALRQDTADLQERMDFTERLLSRQADPARLRPGEPGS
jgi:hypothetical protein